MRALHIGMGDYGFGWFQALTRRSDISLAGVVDTDETKLQKARICDNPSCKLYTDAAVAMDEQKPDFIINATPPSAHRTIIKLAHERNIPVLCEKPIAESCGDALDILTYAQGGQKIMIAENYRYIEDNRFVKKVIEENHTGAITDIKVSFRKHHSMTNYHKDLIYPLLLDVTVHHLDLLRYFLSCEAKSVCADLYTPEWSWYRGYSNAVMFITMKNGIKVHYIGSLDAYDNETSWNGDWEFTGEYGVLRYTGNRLYLSKAGSVTEIPVPQGKTSDKDAILDDFTAYLQTGRVPQTHIFDNIRTLNIAYAAIRSFEQRREMLVD